MPTRITPEQTLQAAAVAVRDKSVLDSDRYFIDGAITSRRFAPPGRIPIHGVAGLRSQVCHYRLRPDFAFRGTWLKPCVNETKRAERREWVLRQSQRSGNQTETSSYNSERPRRGLKTG